MTDTELLNFLQRLNDEGDYTGRCILRMSSNGRGWRLHETGKSKAQKDVRQAISDFVNTTTEI